MTKFQVLVVPAGADPEGDVDFGQGGDLPFYVEVHNVPKHKKSLFKDLGALSTLIEIKYGAGYSVAYVADDEVVCLDGVEFSELA